VGINTDSPAARLHVFGPGQVHTDNGLLILGNPVEAHMRMDFDYIQSGFGPLNTLPMYLQPLGGDVMINGNASLSPIVQPQARFHVHSPGQVLSENGLLLLGDTSEANLKMDFNYIQSLYNGSGLELAIQPYGGNLNILNGGLFVKHPEKFVGVNSSNPLQELWVNGELAFRVPPLIPEQRDKISLNGNKLEATSMVGFGFLNGSTEADTRMIGGQELYSKSNGAHRWYIRKNAGLFVDPQMILDQNAKLGINTGTAVARLHIRENGSGPLFYADVNSVNRFVIQNDGDVGIGTGTPLVDLHVASVNNTTAQLLIAPDVPGDGGISDLLMAEDDDFDYGMVLQYDGSDNKMKFWGVLNNAPQGPHITIERNTGDVAIGSTTIVPNGYKLSVDGRIIAEGLRCELSGNWADYVFDPDYHKLTLPELKRFIQTERHLPGVPSADHMKQTGLDFEQVTVQQQVKIEELFLYVLELKDQLNQQEEAISELQKENTQLQNAIKSKLP